MRQRLLLHLAVHGGRLQQLGTAAIPVLHSQDLHFHTSEYNRQSVRHAEKTVSLHYYSRHIQASFGVESRQRNQVVWKFTRLRRIFSCKQKNPDVKKRMKRRCTIRRLICVVSVVLRVITCRVANNNAMSALFLAACSIARDQQKVTCPCGGVGVQIREVSGFWRS